MRTYFLMLEDGTILTRDLTWPEVHKARRYTIGHPHVCESYGHSFTVVRDGTEWPPDESTPEPPDTRPRPL